MPALEAFRVKWKIGSDDLVFPFATAIAIRVVWSAKPCHCTLLFQQFALISFILGFHFTVLLDLVTIIIVGWVVTFLPFQVKRFIDPL